jgi:hypothetical protein
MGKSAKIIVDVVAVAASFVAGPEIGAAILESTGTAAAAAEAGISAATVGAAAVSGTTSAVNAAVQGKDLGGILKAGAEGAVSGGVGSAVGSAVGGQLAGAPVETIDPVTGQVTQTAAEKLPSGVAGLTGSQYAGQVAGGAAGGAASGFLGSELSGQNLKQSLRGAEIGGLTGGLTSALFPGESGPEKTLAGLGISKLATDFISPPTSPTAKGQPAGTTSATTTSATPTSTTPGSSALAQVLNVGDIGGPIFGSQGQEGKKGTWNVESLRYTGGSTGAA